MRRHSIVRIALMGALGITGGSSAHAFGFGRSAQAAEPSQDLQNVASQADATQAGVVRTKDATRLEFTPYGASSTSIVALDPKTPVFQGRGRIGTQGLLAGVDVRVYLQNRGGMPRAVGVEVLTPQQAQAMRQDAGRVAQQQPTQQQQPTHYYPGGPQAQIPQQPIPSQQPPPVAQIPSQPRPSYPAPQQPTYPAPQQQQMREDGAQAGKIVQAQPGQLILDPYEERAGTAYLQLRGDQVNVTGGGAVSLRDLWSGRDVRVHYQQIPGQRPLVVSVELLNSDQARQWGMRENQGNERDQDRDQRHDHGKHKGWEKQQNKHSSLSGPHQPGKLISVRDGYLQLDPYQRAAGNSKLRIDRDTPVYRDGDRVGIDALQPGADVQVFYDGGRVTAVQLLDRNEANEQRRINEDVPRGK